MTSQEIKSLEQPARRHISLPVLRAYVLLPCRVVPVQMAPIRAYVLLLWEDRRKSGRPKKKRLTRKGAVLPSEKRCVAAELIQNAALKLRLRRRRVEDPVFQSRERESHACVRHACTSGARLESPAVLVII